jgi:NAD(P)-dependent dehydrogenase (short-subunit alcohol dehydrogenase family)
MNLFAPELLRGRTAVVTGGSAGIGLEIAAQFLLHGAEVAVASRQQARLDEASRLLRDRPFAARGRLRRA